MVTITCKNRQFSHIEAIIFDKDGTLEDSSSFLRELAIKRARLIDAQIPGVGEPLLMAFGLQNDTLDPTGLMAVGSRQENLMAAAAYIAETGRGWFEALAIAESAFNEAAHYIQRTAQTCPLFPKTSEFLRSLANAGLKLGILSSDSTANVQALVEWYHLGDIIQLTMGANQGLRKPDPTLLLTAVQTLGVKPENTLMVGDSLGDVQMGKQANVAGTIAVARKVASLSHFAQADVIITQLDEIQLSQF